MNSAATVRAHRQSELFPTESQDSKAKPFLKWAGGEARLLPVLRRCLVPLAVSYSSNAIPSKGEMVRLLKEFKRDVKVREIQHRYSHGNHNHKVGDNNNSVIEYLYVAT